MFAYLRGRLTSAAPQIALDNAGHFPEFESESLRLRQRLRLEQPALFELGVANSL